MAETTTAVAAKPAGGQSAALLLILKLRTFIALIAVVVFFCLMAPNFVSVGNAVIVSKHVAINAFLAIGMTFVILTGGIDLSVGAIVGLVGMVAGALVLYGIPIELLGIVIYPNVWEIIGIALLVGTFVGLVNGLLVTQLQVAPFIATLGMLYVARGTALLMSGGATFPNLVGKADLGNEGFPTLGAGTILGIPLSIWLLLVLALIAAYVALKTPFGRQIYAVGGNERAATLSGVNVNRVKLVVYMVSGLCARRLASGVRRNLRDERHRRRRAGRHLAVRRSRHHRRHHRRRLRHRRAQRRSRHDGRVRVLADGHQGCRHRRRRGARPDAAAHRPQRPSRVN